MSNHRGEGSKRTHDRHAARHRYAARRACWLVSTCLIAIVCAGCVASEEQIRTEVRNRLDANATTAPLALTVVVKERVVYLSGRTAHLEEQRQAVKLARTVEGVRLVVNDMRLDNPLADRVKKALASDATVGRIPIEVEVQGDLVRLSSDQTNSDERARAIQIASAVEGVGHVEDRMR